MGAQQSHPAELGAEMDYEEHEKSYNVFTNIAKYGAMHVATLLIAMAFGFLAGAGFIPAFILLVILTAVGYMLLR
ncbi:aa3-type cytochrome c oxidase subunit IV [Pararhizobium mangrovi]|uniref:Aa3-type cytochrome c oxidase subunit IV n=1 Tax=Pararhizobium mangrovi TaxID=2590452 RepID=A0A506UC27_9HYPH|nr:aa3-type cytochrome c oxidase subunit IV [Pararhizobium mangrovi]TPW30671.1 aa3-type cytochrome c oxidase subunit IV [Pararhizobium mangrovi]